MRMNAVLVRAVLAALACAATVAIPAIASQGGEPHRAPEIQSISYSNAEDGATLIESGVKRASKVRVAVGLGDNRDRFDMARGDHEVGVTFWQVEIPDRHDKCAIVILTAKNPRGSDDRRTRVCTFGETEPEPPEGPLPVP